MKKFNEINIGDSATVVHTITDSDIEKFVELTGDDNKLHVNKEFAKKTEFKKPVVHGMLGASFISTLIGTKLPGDGALWFSQTLEFLRPVRVGDTITVQAQVISKNDKSNTIELNTEIINQNKQVVTTGISKIKVIPLEEDINTINNFECNDRKKTVLILGASGGVGRTVAEKLANEGYNLILHYNSNKVIIDELILKSNKLGVEAISVKADLLSQSEIQELTLNIKRKFSNLTGFINCSIVNIPNIKFEKLEWNDIQKHIDINIKSSFFLLKEILPNFVNQRYGKIVFLTTQYIESPVSELSHYLISKSALVGFVKSLAIEFAGRGINVNMVSPSMIIDPNFCTDAVYRFTKYVIFSESGLSLK